MTLLNMLTALLLIRYKVTHIGKGLDKSGDEKRGKNCKIPLQAFHTQEIRENRIKKLK
jgi:hypothetical protein